MDKLQYIRLAVPDIQEACNDGIDAMYTLAYKVQVEAVNSLDDLMVKTCVDAAKKAGVTDLYLLDKTFVVNALKRALGGAQWIVREAPAHLSVIACSECGTMYQRRYKSYLNFCPNCGTKMDGDHDA